MTLTRRKLFIFLAVIFYCQLVSAQQSVNVGQYYFDPYQINPAYAGLDRSLSITAAYRNQWNGLNRNPRYIYLGTHIPLYVLKGAAGLEASNESRGDLNFTYFSGSYNYVFVNQVGLFSAGMRIGIKNVSINGSNLITPEGIYTGGSTVHNDPVLSATQENGISPYFELGLMYVKNNIKIGLDMSQFESSVTTVGETAYQNKTHFNIFFQYKYDLTQSLSLLPSTLIKYDLRNIQTDLNLILSINGNIFGGIGMRGFDKHSLDAVNAMIGMKLNKNYRISYQYETGISELKRVNEGTHELVLNYNLNKAIASGIPPKAIYNPRDL